MAVPLWKRMRMRELSPSRSLSLALATSTSTTMGDPSDSLALGAEGEEEGMTSGVEPLLPFSSFLPGATGVSSLGSGLDEDDSPAAGGGETGSLLPGCDSCGFTADGSSTAGLSFFASSSLLLLGTSVLSFSFTRSNVVDRTKNVAPGPPFFRVVVFFTKR